jgi:hypothetical protein
MIVIQENVGKTISEHNATHKNYYQLSNVAFNCKFKKDIPVHANFRDRV